MFNYLKGKIIEKFGNTVVSEVNGIGYELTCSAFTADSLIVGAESKIYTVLNVREDGVSLFGFSTKEEKAFFDKLISVSGVGPKSAISILSGDSLEHIIFCIASSDASALSKIKGLGKKTAEKIIVELRDKVDATEAVTVSGRTSVSGVNMDAVTGLMSLGFSRQEAENGVEAAKAEGAKSLEDIISLAIKRML